MSHKDSRSFLPNDIASILPTIFLDSIFESRRLLECKLDRDSRCLVLFPERCPLMLKGSFDARLIFLSELNIRFDVTACACGVDQYPNSIYDTTDHFFPPCLSMQYNDRYSLLIS